MMMELNDGIQIGPAVRATPNLQYIVNLGDTVLVLRREHPSCPHCRAKLSVALFTLAGLAWGPWSF